ncbi:hypothetical protein BCIN_01g07570 [Botrytis cinerea B05.10]|uniref:Uncharacterized protein n=2 Tax=Botryotinia fuckeliana TaxID=40559 RepID=A0A384J6K6_BOTFB|nr:hypothetical protein BCIN_01g07570 [Botrytis cinerea B05.10]ATZ46090.1 hypothetical protein BCIN_01g07570 [Botrytis cinerea B05.10]
MEGMVMITPLHTVFVWPDFFLFQPVLDKHVRQSSSTFKMSSQDSTPKSPRLHHIDTSSNGGVSGPFWDSNERCFWLMNNRQVYTHPENYSGSSACATIASANPDSAYPSGWSRGQRTRSLSGSDNSPNSASHESKRIRPESLGSAPPKNAESKQPLRQGTPEQQRKFPQYDLSNLPPPPPFPPQRSHSVRFSPDISYSDDPVKKHNPGASVPSFPQRSQSVRISNEHDQGFTRSRNPSPSSPPSSSSHPHHKPLPTRPQSFPASTSTSTPTSTSTNPPTKSPSPLPTHYSTHPPTTRYTPPHYLRDPEHEDEDFSSPSSASSAYSYSKSPSYSHHRAPSSRDRHESQRQRTHHRRIEYDYDTDTDLSDQKEKKLRRQKRTRERTPDEQKKHEKTLKSIGETGRGDMGRAVLMGALPLACFLARLAA